MCGLYSGDKWIVLCWEPVHTGRAAALSFHLLQLKMGPVQSSQPQVRVAANPAKPSELHTDCSEIAPDGLSLLLTHDRTDILKSFDGQPECQNTGNTSLSAVPALYQQESKRPGACLRLHGTLDQQHSTLCCLWTSTPCSNRVPQTAQAGLI